MKNILILLFSSWVLSQTVFAIDSPIIVIPADNSLEWHQIMFDWDPVSGADFYQFQLDSLLSFDSAFLIDSLIESDSTGFETSLLLSRFHFNDSYYWRVRCIEATDTSVWSEVRVFTTRDTLALQSPENNSLTFTQVTIDWDAFPGAQYYDYEIDTSTSFNSPLLQAGYKIAFSNQNNAFDSRQIIQILKHDAAYFWRVRPRNDLDTGSWNMKQFQTAIAPELIFPIQDTIGTAVTIDWNAFPGSSHYDYRCDTSLNFNSPALLTGSKNYLSNLNNVSDSEVYLDHLFFNTTYYYQVRARHILDTSIWVQSSFVTMNTINLSSPPDGANIPHLEVLLDWEPFSGIAFYEYQIGNDPNFSSGSVIVGSLAYINAYDSNPDTELLLTNLNFDTDYFWRIRAINNNDTSSWSEVRHFSTPEVPILTYPLNGANTFTGLEFTWEAINGVQYFVFEADTSLDFNSIISIQASVSGGSSHYTEGLRFGENYYWRIKAVGINSESQWTAPASFYTKDLAGLISPANGELGVDSNVMLDWEYHTGALLYQLEIDSSNSFQTSFLIEEEIVYLGASSNLTDTEYLLNNLDSNRFYFWRVRILNEMDTSRWEQHWFSTGIESLVLPDVPLPLMPLLGETDVNNNPLLVWTNVSGISEYQYQISDNSNALELSPIISVSATETALSNLNYLQTYYWRVRSFDGNLISDWSGTYNFTTGQQVLEVPFLISPDSGVVGQAVDGLWFDWSDVTDASFYEIELSTDANFLFDLIQEQVSASEFYAVNLIPGSEYFWRVKAGHTLLINSSWSEVWSLETIDILETPILVSPYNEAVNQVTTNLMLDWEDVENADAYEIQYAFDEYFLVGLVNEVNTVSYFIIQSLQEQTSYFWRVRAIANSFYQSDWAYEWQFTTGGEISIQEFSEESLLVYPNPTMNNISISGLNSGDYIGLFDSRGKVISQERSNGAIYTKQVGSLTPGVYWLRIVRGNEVLTKRFIKTGSR